VTQSWQEYYRNYPNSALRQVIHFADVRRFGDARFEVLRLSALLEGRRPRLRIASLPFPFPRHVETAEQKIRQPPTAEKMKKKANSPVVQIVQLEGPLERLSDCRTVPYLRFFLVRNEEAGGSNPPLVHHIPKDLHQYFESRRSSLFQSKWDAGERSDCSSALYLTSALLATRSSATISLSRRDGGFSPGSISTRSLFVSLSWTFYDGDNQMKERMTTSRIQTWYQNPKNT